jgi:tetratricopeptide (TPR) repeat protein
VVTQQTQDKIDALLREANVLRLRGQVDDAEQRCRTVLELSAEEPTALEMLGDLLRGRGKLEEAGEQYRRAVAAAPGRPSPEMKYAEVALELAERQRMRDAATLLLQSPPSQELQRRNVTMALLLSLIFPGLGQFYNREAVKGGLLVGGSLLCLLMGGDALLRLLFTVATARPSGAINSLGAWFGLLGGVLWLYGVIDAAVTAQRQGRSAGAGPFG